MFRKMRRAKQQLEPGEAVAILERATSGVLAVHGDDGFPYAVPVSHVYQNGRFYFHTAIEGHKVDSIRRDPKVSFCVIDKDDVKPAELTTCYRSVIVFGKARILTDDGERQRAFEAIAQRFSPDYMEKALDAIRKDWNRMLAVEIEIEHITGKVAKELI